MVRLAKKKNCRIDFNVLVDLGLGRLVYGRVRVREGV